MNAQLRENTIKRIEVYGFTVTDNGGKKAPHAVAHPGPGSRFYTVQRALNDDQLYEFASTLDALFYVGRLVELKPTETYDHVSDEDGQGFCRTCGEIHTEIAQ